LTREIEIGANSYVLEADGRRVVLDCGLHPGIDGRQALPQLEHLDPGSVDAIILTHAHQDHLGALPVLQRRQANAPVFMTEPTRQLSSIMLHNSVNVMERKREQGVTDYPLFGHREIDTAAKRWQAAPYQTRFDITGERLSPSEAAPLSFEFFDAGHLLGSAGVMIRVENRTIFYTGDVQFDDQTLSRAATFPTDPVDVLIIETTRGDRPADPDWSRGGEEKRFVDFITKVFARGGAVLIPCFALGKTQETLAMFFDFRRRNLIKRDCPIYIGGLGAKLTEVYDRLAGQTRRHHPNLRLLEEVAPFVLAGQSAREAPVRGGRLYALSSGMMTEHTLSNTLAPKFLTDPKHGIAFIGYCDPDAPGGKIRNAAPGDLIQLAPDSEPVPLHSEVAKFNLSGHAPRESLRAFVRQVRPKKVLLVHGDPAASVWFRETLSADLPGSEILIPEPGMPLEL
jgi:Cft2 family RNA processing exonuclease